MAKEKTVYLCNECGYESLKWMGRCPNCNNWDTFKEFKEYKGKSAGRRSNPNPTEPIKLSEIKSSVKETRVLSFIDELDRVLGGGIVPGSLILLGGDPGIGKSTLAIQTAEKTEGNCLYVTGEESATQISMRAKRLNLSGNSIEVYCETDVKKVCDVIEKNKPELVIVDSVQTMFHPEFDNTPGSVTQLRETSLELMKTAKQSGVPIMLIGHVTKDGVIAGPKILEHMVDTVLQFEGESNSNYRILRSLKNRFGSTNEIGIFEMRQEGLLEVKDPGMVFLSKSDEMDSGSVIACTLEGSRALLIEIQALATFTNFGNPQRVSNGFDYKRLSMLLAVLEKRLGLQLYKYNVHLNVAGGVKVYEPSADLAVCGALISSINNKPVGNKTVMFGEVGLSGEIRAVNNIEKRINEAVKLGFNRVLLPAGGVSSLSEKYGNILAPVRNIREVAAVLLKGNN